ncbi:hypothetical protein BTO07_08090 [Polaribacter sp. SA4-12]|nr:hypothetical protein BTO07_08090 [Polaribacter sp. SA4-12]
MFKAVLGFFRNVYTGYVSKEFVVFGKNSIINFPSFFVGEKYISIGKNVSIGKRSCITAWDKKSIANPSISIGDNTYIGDDCHITAIKKIKIGDNVLFGKKVTITDNSHGNCNNYEELLLPPSRREVSSKGGVIISDRVWLGDKVTVLSGVILGEGVIIGANSVVTKNIPNYSIAAGIPARVIRSYKKTDKIF